MNKHSALSTHDRRLLGSVLALLAAAATIATFGTSVASAGEWMEVSCVNPDQSAAPSEGWSTFSGGGGYGSTSGTNCGPSTPMSAILSMDAAVSAGSNETLQYAPPAGSSLAGGSLHVSLSADGHGYEASGTAVVYTPDYAYDGSDVLFQCDWGLSPCANGTNDFTGILTIPSGKGGDVYLSAGCGGTAGAQCSEGGNGGTWALVRLWSADLLLASSATPGASGVGGTLLAAEARGSRELTLTATDPSGPGVYTVTVQVDGKTLYTGTPDTNGGKCVPVGTSSGVLMFDYSQPCRASEALDLPIETAAVADGQHTLKVTVADAAQNTAVVYDANISTQNAPALTSAPTITAPKQIVVGSALSAHAGSWSAPGGAGGVTYAYQWEDCDTQGNGCQPITSATSASYTPAPSDEGHTLRVNVTASDNDGQTPAASPATSMVLPAQSSLGAAPGPGGNSPTGSGGSPTSGAGSTGGSPGSTSGSSPLAGGLSTGALAAGGPAAVAAANGSVASRSAVIHLGGHSYARTAARSALSLTGRLVDSTGQPISNATLDILQQVAGSSTRRVSTHTTTRADGTFSVRVGKGSSRLLTVAYRAFAADPAYAAQASISESVTANVHLKIPEAHTTSNGSIKLEGTVQGPIPHNGTIIDLLVHYQGRWEPIRTPRTNSKGQFKLTYKFHGGIGRFPFRVEIPGGQAGFPYTRGYSNTVNVTTS